MGKLREVLALLASGAGLPERYRDHALQGDWKGYRDLHIEPDWLLVYRVTADEVQLADRHACGLVPDVRLPGRHKAILTPAFLV